MEQNKSKKRLVELLRVSSIKQGMEGDSPEAQHQANTRHAEKNNYEIVIPEMPL